ncbi:MAG: FadR family transcriptional regulator [Myxococcales bacterium]|nr:FadR family transcriptional regulator [Myxococcales bacterium]
MKKLPSTTDAPLHANDPTDTLAAIGPVARSSVVDAVADRLRREILAGRLEPGSRLPSERELSLALGVNRLTLRAALARLEAMGLVVTRHGSGTEVASWRERAGLEALPQVLASLDPSEPAWLELLVSLLEVRRVLVAEAIALAAERHTEADLAALEARAAEQRANVDDVAAFARGDVAFQRTVIHATRNVGLELLLNSFARFPEDQPALMELLYDRRADSLAFYDGIIALIRAGDADGARDGVRRALEAIDDGWFERHGFTARAAKDKAARDRGKPSSTKGSKGKK